MLYSFTAGINVLCFDVFELALPLAFCHWRLGRLAHEKQHSDKVVPAVGGAHLVVEFPAEKGNQTK